MKENRGAAASTNLVVKVERCLPGAKIEVSKCLWVREQHLGGGWNTIEGKLCNMVTIWWNLMRARVFFHFSTQVDSINSLLKRPVMAKACEETKHFYSDHSHPGNPFNCLCVCSVNLSPLIAHTHSCGFVFTCSRISPNRRLDSSLSRYYSQEHPGGPMEPTQLHQNPGGEPPEICGWYVQRQGQTREGL